MILTTAILPQEHIYSKVNAPHELNLEGICVFIATGFFLDSDTYWKDDSCLAPGANHRFNENGLLEKSECWFKWHYSPRDLQFSQILEEYIELLSKIIKEQTEGQEVILPLSGGLDSRSQAFVLQELDLPVKAVSYSFQNGYPEHKIAEKIAKECNFEFESFKITEGYLWQSIDELAKINNCYSEFTHPRQMCILDNLKKMTGILSLGHWGDVLFDKGAPENLHKDQAIEFLFNKMVKPKGLELASTLWLKWNLDGDFRDYLYSRIDNSFNKIDIDNVSAKVRAFKTQQWAYRWTTTNLSIYAAAMPISLPFYDDRMIEFICTVPEKFLAERKLQIAHLKQNKALSRITWHEHRPFSILSYRHNRFPFNLPYRIHGKSKRMLNTAMGKPFVQRNWELQFIGKENENALLSYLLNSDFNTFIPKEIVEDIYQKFKYQDSVNYAHAVSMLLTLSVWYQKNKSALN